MKFEKDGYGRTELANAIIDHETKKALHLLKDYGDEINVDEKDKSGCSYLFFAAQECEVEVVEALLKLGADPNIMTTSGVSALSSALYGSSNYSSEEECEKVYEQGFKIVKMLLAAGADPDQKSNAGRTMRELSTLLAPGKISDYVCAYPNVDQEPQPETNQEPET